MIQTLRSNERGFTLVEIMIVVAIIGLLAAIAVPSFIRARLRYQATTVLNECRLMDAAKDQYALENNKTGTVTPAFADLTPYLKAGSQLVLNGGNDSLGNAFTIGAINARLQVSATTKSSTSEATGGDAFWGPYS
jgi:prepilin-type N-terminal cleavage/methylation domain-containing protein